LRNAIIHDDTKMLEPEALRKKNGRNQEIKKSRLKKRRILRCDLETSRLGIKSRFEAELALDEPEEKSKISEWLR